MSNEPTLAPPPGGGAPVTDSDLEWLQRQPLSNYRNACIELHRALRGVNVATFFASRRFIGDHREDSRTLQYLRWARNDIEAEYDSCLKHLRNSSDAVE